jgi:hypothetical protein
VGEVVAVGVVFEEEELSGLVEDDDRSSVFEMVVVEVSFLPSPSLPLLDCIDLIGVDRVLGRAF